MAEINSKERERISIKPDSQRGKESVDKDSEKVSVQSRELFQGIEDVVEGAEGMETGNIAEQTGEDRKKTSGAYKSSSASAQVKTQKKNEEPTFEVMAIQVRTHLKQEIAVLQKEAKKYKSGANFSPYKLSQIMGRIRRLREILAELVTAASTKVRQLWHEYVKGGM